MCCLYEVKHNYHTVHLWLQAAVFFFKQCIYKPQTVVISELQTLFLIVKMSLFMVMACLVIIKKGQAMHIYIPHILSQQFTAIVSSHQLLTLKL